MADLLAEVDEAMRQERMEKLWQDYGKSLIAGLVLAVVLVAAISAYRSWDESVKTADTAKLLALTESPDFPENVTADALDMRGGVRGLALMTAAGTFLKQERREQALGLYTQAANDKAVPDDIRQLAVLMRVRILSAQETDEDLIAALQPVIDDKNSPWTYHARLEAAALQAEKNQDYTKARALLAPVLDAQGLPESFTGKARALDHLYTLKQAEQNKNKTDQGS